MIMIMIIISISIIGQCRRAVLPGGREATTRARSIAVFWRFQYWALGLLLSMCVFSILALLLLLLTMCVFMPAPPRRAARRTRRVL